MRTDEKDKINKLLDGISGTAGFTSPPKDYFEQFSNSLNLNQNPVVFERKSFFRRNETLFQFTSLAAAAVLLIGLWVFVFDSGVKSQNELTITIDELLALNDFNNYNEDLLYSELAAVPQEEQFNDTDLELLMYEDGISAEEIIEYYSTNETK